MSLVFWFMPPWAPQDQGEHDDDSDQPRSFGNSEGAGDDPAAGIGQQRA